MVALALLATPVFAQDITPAPAFAPMDLVAPPTTAWATNGGNLYNQRYSPLTQINRDNVAEVRGVWRASLEGSGLGAEFSGQGQTLFYEGVLYATTGENDVFAFDIETGEKIWAYKPEIDPAAIHVCCGRVSRGVGMGEGLIFVGRADAHLVALDQRTGEVVWDIAAEDPARGFAITAAPLYYDGMVIVGYAGGEFGIRGKIEAFSAATGERIWTFHTIPGPGEFGHETWPQDTDAWMFGGAPIWQTPAVDPELGLLIFTTGNPGPDLSGATRPGDNLFNTSFVALDAQTGEYRWHFQQIHHDIWDYDAPQPVILFDATIDGVLRKGAAEISKAGYLYIIDRTDGTPLIGIPEVEVPQLAGQFTAPTQPIPIGDDIVPHFIDIAPEGWDLVNEGRTFTPFGPGAATIWKPSAGANWPPSSYDPQSHLMYICANDGIGGGFQTDEDETVGVPPGERYVRGTFSRPDLQARGVFAAVDLRTNRIAWRQAWATGCQNPSAATAGGLVFLGRSDGRMTALDSSNGDLLWEFQTDAGINSPPTVFEWQGVQYVAVQAAGSIYARNKKGDGLWLFALNGTMAPLPPGSADVVASEVVAAAPVPVPDRTPDLAAGQEIFAALCAACHGDDAQGGHEGGVQLSNALSIQQIMTTATYGASGEGGEMPPMGALYSPEQLHDVAAFVADLVKDKAPLPQ